MIAEIAGGSALAASAGTVILATGGAAALAMAGYGLYKWLEKAYRLRALRCDGNSRWDRRRLQGGRVGGEGFREWPGWPVPGGLWIL